MLRAQSWVLCLFLVLLSCELGWAQWKEIYSSVPAGWHNNGWNGIFYSSDTDLFYLYASNGGGITPESNAFWAYAIHNGPVTSNPWVKVSSCGDSLTPANTQTNRQGFHLVENITATTGTCQGGCSGSDRIHVALNAGTTIMPSNPFYQGNSINGTGVVTIGNEAIRYGKCTGTDSFTGPLCSSTSGPNAYLWGTSDGTANGTQAALIRGTRQTAGWSAPTAHVGGNYTAGNEGEVVVWGCYNPALGPNWANTNPQTSIAGTDHDVGVNRAGSWDHPPDRHPEASDTYDSTRGRIWVQFGHEESYQLQDDWSLPIVDKGGPGGGNALSVAGAADVYTNPQTTSGWQRITWNGNPPQPLYTFSPSPPFGGRGTTENASIYDPQNDVIVEMGGLANGSPRSEILIFCMSTASTAWVCNSGNVGTWIKLSPTTKCNPTPPGFYCGNTGGRDGGRVAYDSVNKRILLFGGLNATYYWNTVAQFDAHTGNVCLSDGGNSLEGSANSTNRLAWCPLPPLTGTPPPLMSGTVPNRNLKFPSWLYDSNPAIQKGVFYGGGDSYPGGGIWIYDSTNNAWSQPPIAGGPTIDSKQPSEQSWAYDSVDDVLVWESGGSIVQLWQLLGSSLIP
jgi:hypothetical protein